MKAIKTVIAWVLSPFVLCLGIQLSGFLFHRFGCKKIGCGLLAAGTGMLLVGSLPLLIYAGNREWEYQYLNFDQSLLAVPSVSALVIVLGTWPRQAASTFQS